MLSRMKKIYVGESGIEGKGIFVSEAVKKGEKICRIEGEFIKRQIKSAKESKKFQNWIGMGHHLWLNPNKTKYRYLNHSCDPSAAIVGRRTLVALRDLPEGEEVTFDYSLTDHDLNWKMECHCGSEQCRKVIHPIFLLPPGVFKKHYPHIPKYFQKIFIKHYVTSKSVPPVSLPTT